MGLGPDRGRRTRERPKDTFGRPGRGLASVKSRFGGRSGFGPHRSWQRSGCGGGAVMTSLLHIEVAHHLFSLPGVWMFCSWFQHSHATSRLYTWRGLPACRCRQLEDVGSMWISRRSSKFSQNSCRALRFGSSFDQLRSGTAHSCLCLKERTLVTTSVAQQARGDDVSAVESMYSTLEVV